MKYYIISFENVETGENKEYYKCIHEEDNIRNIAIKLVDTFKLDKTITRLHIYKLQETIYNDEY